MSNAITPTNTQQLLRGQPIESNKIKLPEEKLLEVEKVEDDISKIVADIRKDQREMHENLDKMIQMLKDKIDQNKSASSNASQDLLA